MMSPVYAAEQFPSREAPWVRQPLVVLHARGYGFYPLTQLPLSHEINRRRLDMCRRHDLVPGIAASC